MGKVNALIVAGGKGKRMNSDKSKQFLNIHGKPLIHRTLEKFSMCCDIDEIYLVLPEDEVTYFEENILKKYKFDKPIIIVKGGKERQDSVYNGLISMEDCEVVLIHDGARPLVSDDIIKDGIRYAYLYGGAAPGVKIKDTIKVIDESGFSKATLNRKELVAIQTPQCFKYSIILEGHNYIRKNKILVTDDTAALELIGHKVFIYEGSYENIKITTKEDLRIAELIINRV
ncbi:2-C-methyl-D-erythritol 4-phosphate cytidylyltransferase [Clostridium algidicarnis]|uniref:2-C-methyl-D-erythritol 4-phosphate cytidylyltransferase n=1 Tax=Clostridium algidicarnis TaxID=37659 RepID=UPI001C0C0B6B|nr:2-C-methyl-D-erythritol 4-phosphate cytidylyltransferase [Clostridium algidicarnis]MBU3192602.1 2-C-methyl-D-erythritol 4-phosphate cytidylyltransferase [Clostridium algidicarnis]MCB2287863.1 2-C-methyl-D-erythritol 4-phosphate cytidylyltransferase [Clostridium algidicarnis]